MRSSVLQVTLGLLVLSSNACSNPGQPVDPYRTVSAQAVKVTPQVIVLSAIGETKQVVATVTPANATDKAIIWESADPTVASVDANGLVTANHVGAGVFITAFTHDGHHQASVNVSVNP